MFCISYKLAMQSRGYVHVEAKRVSEMVIPNSLV